MQPSLGVLSRAPDDGVLRSRGGARRWLAQAGIFLSVMLTGLIVVLVTFFQRSLVAMIVFALLVGALASSVAVCSHAWAWLGVDWSCPIFFDLAGDGLEVGTWSYCFLSREWWSRDSLRDVRVYSALLEFTEDNRKEFGDPVPLQDLRKIEQLLPGPRDVALECWNTCRASCLGTRQETRDVACAFLGARVDAEAEVVRLSRFAWGAGQARELLELAAAARRHAGLPDGPAALEPAAEHEARDSSPIAQAAQAGRRPHEEPPAAPAAAASAAGAPGGGSASSSGAAAPPPRPARAAPGPETYGAAVPQQPPDAGPPGGSLPAAAAREAAAPASLLPSAGGAGGSRPPSLPVHPPAASADDGGPPRPRPKRRAEASARGMAAAPPEPRSPAAPPPPAVAPPTPPTPPSAAGSSSSAWLGGAAAPEALAHGRAAGGPAPEEPPSLV